MATTRWHINPVVWGINLVPGTRIQSAWRRFRERLIFARAQPVDIYLGARHI
jgi:hypothetical protein